MHLVSCEHPKRVYNKYLKEYVWVACKSCPTCLKRYQAYWTSRLEAERRNSVFSLFVTLTYEDKFLPRLHRNDVFKDGKVIEAYSDEAKTFCIPFDELRFESPADLSYFNSKMKYGGVPYARFRDVQLFLKRLNKYFHDKYTSHYGNFHYFIVSELGKESLRPHYHGLLFFRENIKAEDFGKDISMCWKLGNCKTEVVQATASSYVAKYLGKPSFYPSFYSHIKIRNKFVCSKRTPIGSGSELSEGSAEIFHNAVTLVPNTRNGSSEISFSTLPTYVENRLFPKCPRFSQIPHSCRALVYGCAARFHGKTIKGEIGDPAVEYFNFDTWLNNVRYSIKIRPDRYTGLSQLYCLLAEVADGFSEKGVNALRRLYYMSKRVCLACRKYLVSLEYYVTKIEEYWNKKEYKILTMFFDFQQSFAEKGNFEELANMYHEFSFHNKSYLPISLEECRDYQDMVHDNKIYQQQSLFSHLKNAFVDSSRCTDLQSKNLTLNFYHAKKCNEIIEAIT